MKKYYVFLFAFLMCAFMVNTVSAQEFEWPDLPGDAMIIEPGDPGTINETISGDTSAAGERLHQHYILRRGGLYLYTARMINDGWDLMVEAEDGDGALPIVKALGPPPGDDEAPRPFHAQANIYLKGLHIIGWDQSDIPTDNATVRLAADDIKAVIIDCIFDFNRQNAFRLNSDNGELYVENTLIYGQGVANNLNNGFGISFRGNYAPKVHMRNNTWVNQTRGLSRNRGEKLYGTWIFNHNTMVNCGREGAEFGRPEKLQFTNNLIVNPMILGNGWEGDRANFSDDVFAFRLDSNFVEVIEGEDTSMAYQAPNLDFNNNWIYVDPAVTAHLPDTSESADLWMFDEELQGLLDGNESNKIILEAFPFTSFEVTNDEYKQFIEDFYNKVAIPAELPGFDLDVTTVDFGYSNSHAAYTAAKWGQPLGDLNWHADGPLGIREKMDQVNRKVYPNPVQDYFMIDLDTEIDQVEIVNVLGQRIEMINVTASKEVLVNSAHLENGIYFVRCYHENDLIFTHKIMK